MKIKIKKPIVSEEIEIDFPLSFVDNTTVIHCFDENQSIIIHDDHFWYCSTSVALGDYTPDKKCSVDDAIAKFEDTVLKARQKFIESNLNING